MPQNIQVYRIRNANHTMIKTGIHNSTRKGP